jgi:zinc transporter ZupT
MGAFLGTFIGLQFGESVRETGILLASGAFIYMALCTFLQELKEKTSILQCIVNIIFVLLGLFFMYCVAVLE